MNYHKLLSACLLSAAFSVFAAERNIPDNYYKSIDGKAGAELKTALCRVIYPHDKKSYSSLWTYYPETDCKPGTNEVWDIYDDGIKYFPGNGGSVSGMNKEHSFPKSWWGGSNNNAYSDIFHLYPVLEKANSARSNYAYGEVDTSKKITYNNNVSKVGSPVAGQAQGADKVFEPDDRYKGDLARTYFYMLTCYQDLTWEANALKMFDNNQYPAMQEWTQKMLMRWHRNDRVSQKEIDRNEAIYAIQRNRNPFIDFPDLAEYLWGDKADQPFDLEAHLNGSIGEDPETPDTPVDPTDKPVLISPIPDYILHFGEVFKGHTGSSQLIIQGRNLNESKSLHLAIFDDSTTDDASLFTIDGSYISNISSTVANGADGIAVNIEYKPRELGEHESQLVISGGGLETAVSIKLIGECVALVVPSAPVALPATDITATSYTANWTPAPGEDPDYYIVNRTQYIGGQALTQQIETDDTQLEIEDFCGSESYTVQAVRLDVASDHSNAIVVGQSAITGIYAENRFGATAFEDGILITCPNVISSLKIFDMSGRVVAVHSNVENNTHIQLTPGIYLLVASGIPEPIKVLIP